MSHESTIATTTRTASLEVPFSHPHPCPRCGTIDRPTIGPGAGPHWKSARCRHCGRFLRWLSQYTEAERQAAWAAAMAQRPASAAQLAYLTALGDQAAPPATMLDASQRIDALVRGEVGA